MKNIVLVRLQPSFKIEAEGTPDRCEFYCISRGNLLAVSDPLPNSIIILSHRPLLKRFVTSAQALVATSLDQLNESTSSSSRHHDRAISRRESRP